MPPDCTVRSYQGCESDIVVLIMGTSRDLGPGFTRDAKRLNVMLTRHRCGLLVVGDISVVRSVLDVAPPMGETIKHGSVAVTVL